MADPVSEESKLLDELILQQEESIREEIRNTQDLVDPVATPLDWLLQKYAGNELILTKIREGLVPRYGGLRRVRADGNCFFRAFLTGLLFAVGADSAAAGDAGGGKLALELEKRILGSLDLLEALGYSRFVVEDFHETLVEQLQWIAEERPSEDQIAARLIDPELDVSEAAVMCLRFMCGAELKSNPDEYVAFVPPEYNSLAEFVAKEVDVVFHDADSLHILGLTRAIQVPVKIEYLDRSEGQLNHHVFGEGLPTLPLTLLYEPGHYHLLLAAEQQQVLE